MLQVAFVDLDDTLFSSLPKQRDRDGLEPAALLRGGEVISYSSPAQRALARWIRCSDIVVPVTARTAEAYKRVLLDFGGPAVVSHGATILDADGSCDSSWQQSVDRTLHVELEPLHALLEVIRSYDDPPGSLSVRLAGEPGRPAYLVGKNAPNERCRLEAIANEVVIPWLAENPKYRLHLNGNNLAVLPPSVRKCAAVRHLIARFRDRHGELFILGAGDSVSDAPFLSLCDVALIPTHSQLWRQQGASAPQESQA